MVWVSPPAGPLKKKGNGGEGEKERGLKLIDRRGKGGVGKSAKEGGPTTSREGIPAVRAPKGLRVAG